MRRVFDLTQPIKNGMTFFPGDPEPRVAPATATPPWRVSELHLGTHTGTHIDAPSHFLANGKTIDGYSPARFLVLGLVVPVSAGEDEPIGAESIAPHLSAVPPGGAVMIRTGWDRFWTTGRYLRHPYLTPDAARALADAGAGIVGVDALNVDSTPQELAHVHEILLSRDVLIVENLTHLDQLDAGALYSLSFMPLALSGLDGSPVRAIGWD